MALAGLKRNVRTGSGAIIPAAEVEVRYRENDGTAGALATIYSNNEGTTAITQPGFVTDADGAFEFFAASGQYLLVVGSGASQESVPIDIVNANQVLHFDGRSEMEAWVAAGYIAPDGTIATDGTVSYKAASGATGLTSLGGWRPFGMVIVPEHFAQNTTPGTTDMTSAWTAFLAYLISSGLQGGGLGQYLVSDDFVVTSAIKLDLFGCYIKQATDGRGFLQLRGNGHDVRNVDAILATTRTNASGNYRGYSADQRMCVVWAEGGQNEIHNIRGENFFNTLCLRGPVEQNPAAPGYTGADDDPQSTYIYTTLTTNNNVTQIWGQTQDFAVTGHQQDGLSLDGYGLRDVTEVAGIPPHAIYMTNDDADCINCSIQNGFCENGTTGVAHKFQRFDRSCSFRNLYATKTAGVANFIQNYGYAENLIGLEQDDTDGGNTYVCYVDASEMVIRGLSGAGSTDSPCGLIYAQNGADCKVYNLDMTTRFPAAGTVANAAVAYSTGTCSLDLFNVTHVVAGSDRVAAFVTAGGSTATIIVDGIRQTGSTLLANGAGGDIEIFGQADLINGFDAITLSNNAYFKGQFFEKSVLEGDQPLRRMIETDAPSTYRILDDLLEAGDYKVRSRQSDGTLVSTDYIMERNASGSLRHRFRVQNADAFTVEAGIARMEGAGNNPYFEVHDTTSTVQFRIQASASDTNLASVGPHPVDLRIDGNRIYLFAVNGNLTPGSDNAQDLGSGALRMRTIYAGTGTINTSDELSKQDIQSLSKAELRVSKAARALLKKYRFKDAVDQKGNQARWHFGVIAQDLKAAFDAEGLDGFEYGVLCHDTWWRCDVLVDEVLDEKTGEVIQPEHYEMRAFNSENEVPEGALNVQKQSAYGVRYDELFAFILASI